MLALYRSGRQSEALEAGRQARALLADEIGVDPGDELQYMERAILARDPALDLPRPAAASPGLVPDAAPDRPVSRAVAVPRQLPPSIADFTGRAEQLAEIRQVLTGERDRYAMPIVAVSGQGGVGKSSLAVRAAQELVADFPDGQLYANLTGSDGEGGAARQLARFLRALGVPGSGIPEDPQERAELYRSQLAGRRVLVVLDDVTDEDQVLPLLPGSPESAVITTSRVRLTGLPGAHWVDVDVLPPDQAEQMLGSIIGADRVEAEPVAGTELVDLCDGLPLALRIAGARLAFRRHWRVEDLVRRLGDESGRLDELSHKGLELRSNIALTYEGLSDLARRLFRLSALVPAPDFPVWAAAALLDVGLDDAEDVLESLVDAQVLTVLDVPGDRSRRYRFHELVRVFALERLAEEERAADRHDALVRYLGGWLSLSDEAHRRHYGGDYTVLHGSAPRWVPPDAELPERVTDPLAWWERELRGLVAAIRRAATDDFDEACWDLALTSVTLFETRSYFDDWVETAELAAQVTARSGNRRGQGCASYSLGTLAMGHKRLDEAERHFEQALQAFRDSDDRHGRALVLRNAAFVSRVRGDDEAMRDRYVQALEDMRAVGDRVGEAHVLASLARVRMDDEDVAGARGMLDEAAAICREAPSPRVEAQVTYRLAELHLATGDIDQAREALHRTLRTVRSLGDRAGEAYALQALGIVRQREGRLDSARTTLTHAASLARQVGDRWIEGQALFGLGGVVVAQGDVGAGTVLLQEAADLFGEIDAGLWQAKSLILVAEATAGGDPAAAARRLDRAVVLLAPLDSAEAGRWRSRARRSGTAALSDDLA
jgi:tetratricopeptide (TPR) repeat protein